MISGLSQNEATDLHDGMCEAWNARYNYMQDWGFMISEAEKQRMREQMLRWQELIDRLALQIPEVLEARDNV